MLKHISVLSVALLALAVQNCFSAAQSPKEGESTTKAGIALPMKGQDWQVLWWIGESPFSYEKSEYPGGGVGLKLQANGKEGSATYYTPIVGVNVHKDYTAKFQYRANAAVHAGFALSAGPGCGAPSIKAELQLEATDEWKEVSLPIYPTGMSEERMIAEFLFDRGVPAGLVLEFKDIVVEQAPQEKVGVELFSPRNGQIFEALENQNATLKFNSADAGRTFQVKVVSAADQKIIHEESVKVEGKKDWGFDLKKHPVGAYRIEIANGDQRKEITVEKFPVTANSVLIQNQVPYVDGKPFLAIGIYHIGEAVINIINKENADEGSDVVLDRDTVMAQLAERGFNTVHHGWGAASGAYHESAEAHGLMVINEVSTAPPASLAPEIKTYKSLFGYYGIDEPSANRRDELVKLYDAYKEFDPYHPMMSAVTNGGVGYGSSRLMDISMPDLYPITSATSSVSGSALYTINCREILNHGDPSTSVLPVVHLFAMDGGRFGGYEPQYPQVRAEVFVDLCSGAKGITYYAYYTTETLSKGMPLNPKRKHWYLPESPLWNQIGALNAEIASLKDFILFGESIEDIKFTSKDGIMGDARKQPDGSRIMLVVNPEAKKGNVSIAGLGRSSQFIGKVNGSPEPRRKSDWTDIELPPYGVGVYEIKD